MAKKSQSIIEKQITGEFALFVKHINTPKDYPFVKQEEKFNSLTLAKSFCKKNNLKIVEVK